MSDIFICYRHSDRPHAAQRIYDRLVAEFSADRVFIDEHNLPVGSRFPKAIRDALSKAKVLLVIIGPGWLNACDSTGQRRIEDPDDFLCKEVARAFRRKIWVFPILIEKASMPNPTELPDKIRPLASLIGKPIGTGLDFKPNMHSLISELNRTLDIPQSSDQLVRDLQASIEKEGGGLARSLLAPIVLKCYQRIGPLKLSDQYVFEVLQTRIRQADELVQEVEEIYGKIEAEEAAFKAVGVVVLGLMLAAQGPKGKLDRLITDMTEAFLSLQDIDIPISWSKDDKSEFCRTAEWRDTDLDKTLFVLVELLQRYCSQADN